VLIWSADEKAVEYIALAESYPVMLHLEGRPCVVVGGGKVAARKVAGLLAAGALVTVISPDISTELQALVDVKQISLMSVPYRSGLLDQLKPALIFAATDNPLVNQQVMAEGHEIGALANRADAREAGDFENMAAFRRGTITVAVSTGGAAPALAKHLAERLETHVGDEYVTLAEWMAARRPEVQIAISSQVARAALWNKIIESPILDHLRQGNVTTARVIFDELIAQAIGEAS
jgi:precorrin-2 dehydrogenase/sirohydrochlorin ferrochelatase